ncbi:MAG: ABC transporter ATP-binding protein/permease [Phyllobacteriaceae bacterium]|nr:ABC transporter ATP-binding protein/permease [Phyllobacteriaceae bacterium]
MSNVVSPTPEAGVEVAPTPSFTAVALPFWTGSARAVARRLTAAVAALVVVNVALLYGVNRWNKSFFDALDRKDLGTIVGLLALFAGLVAVGGGINLVLTRLRLGLQAEWRRWLTTSLVGRWLGDCTYYKLEVSSGDFDNPEARMSEDLKQALAPLVDMTVGLFNALLAAATFIGVLAFVGGTVELPVLGHAVSVPFAFVLLAVVYATVMSASTWVIGRPLIAAVEATNAAEADLRFELTRVRESAESIALVKGEDEEKRRLGETVGRLAATLWGIARNHGRITLLTNVGAVVMPVAPLLLGAPKYVAGGMSLGDLMQISAAFVQVQLALNWVMDNFILLASWRGAANRLVELVGAMDEVDRTVDGEDGSTITVVESEHDELRLSGLAVRRDDGTTVIDAADGVVRRGERVMVVGESGTGKSTLIRAIAGLWPWGAGEIALPPDWTVMFLPQTPYLPLGTLRACLAYPDGGEDLSDDAAHEALTLVGLDHLAERLDDEDRWDHVLSGGERQRVAFARVFLCRPDLVVMDEATSALDEDGQAKVMSAFVERLPEATLISVAHRPSLAAFHTRTVTLKRVGGGVRLVRGDRVGARLDRGFGRLLTTFGKIRREDRLTEGTETRLTRSN